MKEFEMSNYHIWRQAGYTGKGVKVVILDDYTMTEYEKAAEHSESVANHIKLVAPDVDIEIMPQGITALDKLKTHDCQFICMPTGGIVTTEINNLIRDIMYGQTNRMFIVSAGNNTSSVERPLNGFARNKRVITVGAVHLQNNKPVRPSYSMTGENVYCTSFSNILLDGVRRQGTSYSAPFTVGGLALYAEFFEKTLRRRLAVMHIRRLIRECALDLEAEGHDYNTGYGLFRLPDTIRII